MFKTLDYLNTSKIKSTYNFSKNEKKAFLFFDINTEYLADVMFNGCNFVFKEKKITIFPIYFSGQLMKKKSDEIGSKIPTQLYRTPETSVFKDFNLKNSDFPILVVYNEKNELCGFSKNVTQIGEINCQSDTVKFKVLRLKFLIEGENKGLIPYSNKTIYVLSGRNNDTIANFNTNNDGDLNVEIPDLNKDYLIKVNESDKNINFMVLGTQTGIVVGKFKSVDQGFEYKITKSKLKTLPGIKKEDNIDSKFADLKKNPEDDFIITESLYYELGKSELSQSSKDLLVKIKNGLNLYPAYRLLVFSHTDAQGNDDDNLKLSAKRSEAVIEYLIFLGIKKERLSAEGKGETQIRNRCVNDVDCSDKEHEYNRRTEFLFSK
jgi:outer membrane protein OmpA-like peptidoglycan-associated protein